MDYISVQQAVEVTGQNNAAILAVIRLIEDGHFPSKTLKRYYIDGRWLLYIEKKFIEAHFSIGSDKVNEGEKMDYRPLASALIFIALFALIWYIGGGIVRANDENNRLKATNTLQQKALQEAYSLIERKRNEAFTSVPSKDMQDLDTVRSILPELEVFETNFEDIAPVKVAVE